MALRRLKITPDIYYDLTLAETLALLEGESDRETTTLRAFRRIATLLRNAHFEKPVKEEEYIPLPGDEDAAEARKKEHTMPPAIFIQMLNELFPQRTLN